MTEDTVKRAASYRRTTLYDILLLSNYLESVSQKRDVITVGLVDDNVPEQPTTPLVPVKWPTFTPRPFKLKPTAKQGPRKGLELKLPVEVTYEID
ncbi:hypothetical protein FT663_05423 [Candidozyma haemuli var. vulneris]|nr:hypothetical protein FT663_05423 [[Candida] haemuloni var. vulneris]KAF3989120.1 hypothetical protein FT662_03016 [[Candida] haemuloni var. vulneris]